MGKIPKDPRYFPHIFPKFDSTSYRSLPHSYLERSCISSGIGIWTKSQRRAVAKFNISSPRVPEMPWFPRAGRINRATSACLEGVARRGVGRQGARGCGKSAFINYRTRAVRRWNALRRSSAPCQMWPACPRRCTSCPANCFTFTFFARSPNLGSILKVILKEFGKYRKFWWNLLSHKRRFPSF